LRLWLALVVDDDETDLTRIAPLPNLDGHVRQGDALLDPLALAPVLGGGPGPTGGTVHRERLGGARRAVRSMTGPPERRGHGEPAGGGTHRLPAPVRRAWTATPATWRPAHKPACGLLPTRAVAFVERALALPAPGGMAPLPVPAKLASSGDAAPLRRLLARGT